MQISNSNIFLWASQTVSISNPKVIFIQRTFYFYFFIQLELILRFFVAPSYSMFYNTKPHSCNFSLNVGKMWKISLLPTTWQYKKKSQNLIDSLRNILCINQKLINETAKFDPTLQCYYENFNFHLPTNTVWNLLKWANWKVK